MPKKNNGSAIPCDPEAEAKVIGTMLENQEAIGQAGKFLCAEDFWDEVAGAVLTACLDLLAKGAPVNRESILASRDSWAQEVSPKDITRYMDWAIPLADAVEFASNISRVKNASILRQLMGLGNKILKDIASDEADALAVLQDTRALIDTIETGTRTLPPRIVGLEIATTNPRSYRMKLSNGKSVSISIDDLLSPGKVKRIVTNALDFVPALPKDWEGFIRRLMQTASVCQTSGVDVTLDVLDAIKELFAVRGEAKAGSDLRTGSYATDMIGGREYYLFQKRAVVNHIKQQVQRDIDSVQLWRVLQQWGALDNKDGKPISKRIGEDSRTGLWGLPATAVDEQAMVDEAEIEDMPWD